MNNVIKCDICPESAIYLYQLIDGLSDVVYLVASCVNCVDTTPIYDGDIKLSEDEYLILSVMGE